MTSFLSCFVVLVFAASAVASANDNAWETELAERARWWSLQPLKQAEPPMVEDSKWSFTAVDRFVLDRLTKESLTLAPPADPGILMRRLSFVLTGLPPTPEQLKGWSSHNDLSRVTEELLASTHFGERIARHWMDVARYADTYGYEWDNPAKGSWRYRDYLIRAFNADVGFDQLIREQVAGDLLPSPRINEVDRLNESLIGTMFLHLGEHRHGDSLNFNGIHQEMVNNKIDAFSKAFLGLTMACARCHDHKLDPISQKDYYALAGVFMSARWTSRVVDAPGKHDRLIGDLKGLREEIRAELGILWKQEASWFTEQLAEIESDETWRKALGLEEKEKKTPPIESIAHPIHQLLVADANASRLKETWLKERRTRITANKDFKVLADFSEPVLPEGWVMEGDGMRYGYVTGGQPLVSLAGDNAVERLLPRGFHTGALSSKLPGSLRMPVFSNLEHPSVLLRLAGGEWSGHLTLVENALQGEKVKFLNQTKPSWHRIQTFKQRPGWDVRTEIATSDLNPNFPPRTGLANAPGKHLANKDMGFEKRSWFSVTEIVSHSRAIVPRDEMESFATLHEDGSSVESATLLGKWLSGAVGRWAEGRASEGDVRIVNWLLENNLLSKRKDLSSKLDELVIAYRKTESAIDHPQVVNGLDERKFAPVAYRLNLRGEVNNPGDPVQRDFLGIFSDRSGVAESPGSGRLELADFLVSSENPLTSRVYVNRVWKWIFGKGLVGTPNDFGHLGEKPSHPELLDWLAKDFVRNGWSTKRLVRQLVSSRAFRQSGVVVGKALELDPDNRLLHHYSTRRLEAEAIRDSILAVSGRLDRKLYGRPVEPPRVREHPPKRLFSGPRDGLGRRSIYLRVTMMELPSFLTGFNFPDPKLSIGDRDATNVPAQALQLLNDPLVAGQAGHWGKQLARASGTSVVQRIEGMFLRALGREPEKPELERWQDAWKEFARVDGGSSGKEEEAWKALAHAFFNTKEFIYYR